MTPTTKPNNLDTNLFPVIPIRDYREDKLTETKLLDKETDPAWIWVEKFYNQTTTIGRPDTAMILCARMFNACLHECKAEFLMSIRIMRALSQQDPNAKAKTFKSAQFNAMMAIAKANGWIEELSAPTTKGGSGARAGVYKVLVPGVINYIEGQLNLGSPLGRPLGSPEVRKTEERSPKVEVCKSEVLDDSSVVDSMAISQFIERDDMTKEENEQFCRDLAGDYQAKLSSSKITHEQLRKSNEDRIKFLGLVRDKLQADPYSVLDLLSIYEEMSIDVALKHFYIQFRTPINHGVATTYNLKQKHKVYVPETLEIEKKAIAPTSSYRAGVGISERD